VNYSLAVPDPVLPAVGAVVVIIACIVALVALERRRTAARREAFAQEAARRGWRHAAADVRGRRVDRFQGTSLAGAWTAEVVERHGRKRPGVRLLRWWNGDPDAVASPSESIVLLVPSGAESRLPLGAGALGDGVVARMAETAARAALAFGVDHHFGPLASIKGRVLHRLDMDGPIVDGFVVLSDAPDEARRRLTPGRLGVLRQALRPGAWDGRAIPRPWVTLAGDRLAIAVVSQSLPTAADVAALADAGAAIAGWRD
jgi:hypothetical protein